MADVAGGLLAAEVTEAGGLGMIAAGHFQDVTELEREIEIFHEQTKELQEGTHSGLAIGFIGFSSLGSHAGWQSYEYILKKYQPKAVQFFAPAIITQEESGRSNVEIAHEHGAKFIAQVGSIQAAKEAIQYNVDAIICQGTEAGGHGLRRNLGNSTMALASQTSNLTRDKSISVLAAGGIVTGKQLASLLCVCDGVSIGTRYWACKESIGNTKLQANLIANISCDNIVRTTVFDQIQNELATQATRWSYPYDSVGAVRNRTTAEWESKSSNELKSAIFNTDLLERYRVSRKESDSNVVPTLAGEGVGEIDSIEGAYDVTLRLEREAAEAISRLSTICP